MPQRRIMREFRIDELSAVDRPAQEHAKMAILKSADSEQEYTEMNTAVSFKSFAEAVQYLNDLGGSRTDALRKAARRFPQLRKQMNDDAVSAAGELHKQAAPSPAVTRFTDLVAKIATDRHVSRSAAMALAKREYPQEFAAYNA